MFACWIKTSRWFTVKKGKEKEITTRKRMRKGRRREEELLEKEERRGCFLTQETIENNRQQ